MSNDDDDGEPITVPISCQIQFQGFDEETAYKFGEIFRVYVRELSRIYDLSTLDGITIAADYGEALSRLDRGVKTENPLTPSSEDGIGVAMTVPVLRDGRIRSHIVFYAPCIWPLHDFEHADRQQSLYILAHECAHVVVTQFTDQAFPGLILRHTFTDFLDALRGQVIDVCWDEYAASLLSAPIGADNLGNYEDTFVTSLREAPNRADRFIYDYRLHGDHSRVFAEVSRQYGNLMKFASYLIGHLHGRRYDRSAAPKAVEALADHWFAAHFDRLEAILAGLWDRRGCWQSREEFAPLADLAEEVLADGGVIVSRTEDRGVWIDVPFNPRTMPGFHGK